MGNLESVSRRNTKRKNIQKVILGTVATAGILSVAVLTPNVLVAMNKLGLIPGKRQKEFIKRSRDRLIRKGLLEFKDGYLRLTPKGEVEIGRIQSFGFKLQKPKRWDKKWRVLIFDIKESRRGLREKIRRTLTSIGFVRLQDSVWIFPYDCEDLVTLLKADFKIGKDLLYMIVEQLEYDNSIREKFGLPKNV